jgi:hypothetical protein
MSEQLANPQSIRQDFAIPGRVMLHTLSEALNNRRQQLAELGCRKKSLLNFLCKFVYICLTLFYANFVYHTRFQYLLILLRYFNWCYHCSLWIMKEFIRHSRDKLLEEEGWCITWWAKNFANDSYYNCCTCMRADIQIEGAEWTSTPEYHWALF